MLEPVTGVTTDGGVPYYQYFCSFHHLPPVTLTSLAPHSLHLITYNEGRTFTLQAKPGKKTNVVDLFAKILGPKELSEVNFPKICVYLQYSEHTDWQQCGVFGTHKDFKALLWFFLLLLFLLAAFSSCPLKCFVMFCSPELISRRLPCCSTWLWVPYSSSGLFVFFLGCLSFSELLLSFFLLPETGSL